MIKYLHALAFHYRYLGCFVSPSDYCNDGGGVWHHDFGSHAPRIHTRGGGQAT